jgi:hypothetical protein
LDRENTLAFEVENDSSSQMFSSAELTSVRGMAVPKHLANILKVKYARGCTDWNSQLLSQLH